MEQDLFSWLNSQKDSRNTGLLVAPLIPERQEDNPVSHEGISPSQNEPSTPDLHAEIAQYVHESNKTYPEHQEAIHGDIYAVPESHAGIAQYVHESNKTYPEHQEAIHGDIYAVPESHAGIAQYVHESNKTYSEPQEVIHGNTYAVPDSPDEIVQYVPESEQSDTEAYPEPQAVIHGNTYTAPESPAGVTQYVHENSKADTEAYPEPQAVIHENTYTAPESPAGVTQYVPENEYADSDEIPQDHEWQERATGFTLSLDEPPPELWTHINDDDPEPDYEPTDSLQGAAYVQIHGRNFTERLHNTLRHRKERAEERAQSENDTDPSSPFRQMAVILCGTLIIALGFACLALWFVGRETPDGMKSRAESLTEAGKFDEAAEIYRRAHRRYPNDPEILAGLSDTSQKLGHVQTAKTAHDEYIRLTSPDTQPPAQETATTPKPEPETPSRPAPVSLILNEKPLTFDECMSEANHAYNIGMYTRALEYFSRAMKLNSRDLRPYIGLSASYRMKGWYVDSMHILDEARRILGRSPALDMETYFLREAK